MSKSKQEAISCEHCGGDGIYITSDSERVECPMCEKGEITKEEPKQETLEEAVKREYESRQFNSDFPFNPQSFKLGAKWQAERMYSEEDMVEFGEWCENLQRDNKDIRRNNPDITRKELLEFWKKEFKNHEQ